MTHTPGGAEITIVGAGLAGSLLACLLGEAGYRTNVFERRPDPREKGFIGGRSINLALSTRGIHALERAGLAEMVLGDAIPMRGRLIHTAGRTMSFQPYSKRKSDAINSVSRGGLNLTLIEAADRHSNVTFHFESRCIEIDHEAPEIVIETAAGGRVTVSTHAIIGADGAFSVVRGHLQKLDRFDYRQDYLAHGYKELTIPPTDAGEFAMEPNALHIWPRGGFMMIALPNTDRSFTCTLFWPFDGPRSFAALRSDEAVRNFFVAHFPDAVPLMPALLEEYRQNPVGSLVTVRCNPWHLGDRVLVIGDAAHAVVPFYGQGMNAAFEDCVELLDQFAKHADRATAFANVTAARRPHADAIADMAIGNFLEMRDHVASPSFRLKKRMQRILHRTLPWCYTPLYNLVTFTRVPYDTARRRAATQTRRIRRVAIGALVVLVIGVVMLAWQWGQE